MSEIELKARELLASQFKPGGPCAKVAMAGSDTFTVGVIRAMAAALAPQWQPISSAPKDGRPLLLDHPDWHSRVMRGGWDAHELAWRVHGFGCPATQPTKWQPLPAPPEVEG